MVWFWKKNREAIEREFLAYNSMICEQMEYLLELFDDYKIEKNSVRKLKLKSSIRARSRSLRSMLWRIL